MESKGGNVGRYLWKKPKNSSRGAAVPSLNSDILCMIFAYLDHFDLVRCSSVSKSWNNVINTLELLKLQCYTLQKNVPSLLNVATTSRTTVKMYLQNIAMEQHRLSLQNSYVDIDQWNGHSARVDQCRMKMGFILTGLGDKVMRIWSLESYRCLEEYSVSDLASLVDFDFDESKISKALINCDNGVIHFSFGNLKMEVNVFNASKAPHDLDHVDSVCMIDTLAEDFYFLNHVVDPLEVVGLVGTQICIWRRHGKRSIFPSREGTFSRGLCMRYVDPEAVVGCGDGTARVFDMYSRKCSRIIKMHNGPITCLALTDDQLILSGSSLGSVTVAGLSSDQHVASLKSSDSTGIRSLCFNPNSYLVFAGSSAGYSHCWDLRTLKPLWETRISPNVIYSMQHQQNDTSSLVVGGIDGVLRIQNQDTGKVLSSYVINDQGTTTATSSNNKPAFFGKKKAVKLSEDARIDSIPKDLRPPITCLAVGMKKVVTTHNSKFIRLWQFSK